MVGAGQIVPSWPSYCEKDVFALARLQQNLGAFAIEHVRVIDLSGAEKQRRRELVQMLATIFKMQPVMHAGL